MLFVIQVEDIIWKQPLFTAIIVGVSLHASNNRESRPFLPILYSRILLEQNFTAKYEVK